MKLNPSDAEGRGNGCALPLQTRSIEIANIDDDNRTIELIWTTGAKVRRYDWYRDEPYDEELVVSNDTIDLTRLNSGAPLLERHNGFDLRCIIGVVEKAWLEGGNGLARVRFPKAEDDPESDKIYRKIKDKIIRNVSVGYRVRKVERVRAKDDDEITLWRVVDWEPFEISIVSVPADVGAGIRSDNAKTYPLTFINRANPEETEELPMVKEVEKTSEAKEDKRDMPVVNQQPHDVEVAGQPPVNAEAPQERSWSMSEIQKINQRASGFGLDASAAIDVMSKARDLDHATDMLNARAADKTPARQFAHSRVLVDDGDTKRAAIENAVAHRARPGEVKLTDAAREYRGMTLLEMGRAFVEDTHNVRLRGLTKMELASVLIGLDVRSGMMSTSDFPKLLGNVASTRLRDTYGATVQTWKPFSRQNNAPDFKDRATVALAGMPELKKILEGQEYTFSKLSETSEKWALATYGRKIAITRQTLINDDLGAFERLPALYGRAAANLESNIVWDILLKNQKMSDGKGLFHVDHGNLSGASDITEEAIDKIDVAMGAQLGADETPLNIKPKFLAVSRKHKLQAQKLLAAVAASKTEDVNTYVDTFTLIVEDRLYNATGACPWFMIADPATWDTIEYGYLEGEEGLYVEERVGFDVDGIEIKARLDFAAHAIDYRGMHKNPGK